MLSAGPSTGRFSVPDRRMMAVEADVTIVTELDLPAFDYSAPELTGEAYHRRLAELREKGWLAQGPLSYIVLDREAGEVFLRSRATAFPGRQIADLFGITGGRLREQIDANILNQTGEVHRRLRSLVGPAFTPRAAARWRPGMGGFLGPRGAGRADSADFVDVPAKPYPSLTIAAVLGAPLDDAPKLHEWSNLIQRQFDPHSLMHEREAIERACAEFYEWAGALIERRRDDPGDDLISTLIAASHKGDRLDDAECMNLVLNVLVGGVDTTQSQLAHALRVFAAPPARGALLAERPELASAAVEELLRYEPITPFTARILHEEVEYRGVTFAANDIVMVCSFAGNRDGVDGDPEAFDITADRGAAKPLTFGARTHHCLGANLARAELQEALAFLPARMPGLTLDGEAELGAIHGIYGLERLPIAWT